MDHILRSRGEAHQVMDNRLVHDSDFFMVAGPETTATILLGVTYYLPKTPDAYKRAIEELRAVFSHPEDITFKLATAKLPYTLACLNEALRIFPSVHLAMFRVTNLGEMTPIPGQMTPPRASGVTLSLYTIYKLTFLEMHWSSSTLRIPLAFELSRPTVISPRTMAIRK